MREILSRAFEIVEALQDWIEDRDGLSTIPNAWVTYTPACEVAIGVGASIIWTTESGYCDEDDDASLSYSGCKRAFLSTVYSLQPFFSESEAVNGETT